MSKLDMLVDLAAGTFFGVLIVGLAAAGASGQTTDATTLACLETCRTATHDCLFDSREAFKDCLDTSGCETLRDTYRSTCLVENRDETACTAARDALKACVEPCRTQARTDGESCREASDTCVTETCGVTVPTRPTRPTPSGTPRPEGTPGMGHGPGGRGGERGPRL